jgi:hypothetical protein
VLLDIRNERCPKCLELDPLDESRDFRTGSRRVALTSSLLSTAFRRSSLSTSFRKVQRKAHRRADGIEHIWLQKHHYSGHWPAHHVRPATKQPSLCKIQIAGRGRTLLRPLSSVFCTYFQQTTYASIAPLWAALRLRLRCTVPTKLLRVPVLS